MSDGDAAATGSATVDGLTTLTDAASLAVYATDNSIYQVEPSAVVLPRSAEQVRQVVAAEWTSTERRPLVARGGGTGTNGQSLTDGLVVDVKRHLNRVLAIDPERREARVQPGLVTAALNRRLADHGLFWAPHTSTLNRATVGGMISTDAAGKGSLIHGRANRHVLALEVVLDDGTPWRAEPTPVAEAEAMASSDDRIGRLWRSLLDLPIAEGDGFGLPELARGFSGYGIDRFGRDGLVDPLALLCGSEGTLAVVTEATIRLTPIPAETVLVVAGYDSFADALDDAVALAATGPSAIETFDETTLERGRSSPAWPAMEALVDDDVGSVLLLEYTGEEPIDVASLEQEIRSGGRSRSVRAASGATQQAGAWKVRADAVGLLAKVATRGPGTVARPTAFVEDCAVPVANMGAFIAGFRRMLDDAGLTYGMFGHADVGCVHVRPALDLTDPTHETLVRTITDRVVDLVAEHGGVLWGEHGRGFRGDSAAAFLSQETVTVMEQVKAAFDPEDRFNPGKLYRPAGHTRTDRRRRRTGHAGHGATGSVPVSHPSPELADAFACNGNALCHHMDGAEVMCPSYKATGDPALSPKGRADLLRAWWRPGEANGADDLRTTSRRRWRQPPSVPVVFGLHRPLPGRGRHPRTQVPLPRRLPPERRRPRCPPLPDPIRDLAMAASRVGAPAGPIGGIAGRLLGLVDLPTPGRRRLGQVARFDPDGERPGAGGDAPELVMLPDVFTAVLDPELERRAVDVLEAVGSPCRRRPVRPLGQVRPRQGQPGPLRQGGGGPGAADPCDHRAGATPVVLEPATGLLHHHEYPAIRSGYPRSARHLVEILDKAREPVGDMAVPGRAQTVTLLGHCTERATAPGLLAAWIRVLRAAGHEVIAPEVGCCGMAGIFGHEVDNQQMSMDLWQATWAEHLASADTGDRVVAATGYSCRSQAGRLAGRRPLHPVELLGADRTSTDDA